MPQKNPDTVQNSNRIIPVFLNADNGYAMQTYITVFSMMYNYKGAANIDVYILNADGFSKKNEALLHSLEERFDKLRLTVLHMDNKYDNVNIEQAYISNASMHRLEIPRIVENMPDSRIEKCIYLDCDLVVEGDISELYHEDISGYYIGGVADPMQVVRKYRKYPQRIGIPDLKQYINSGVMLMNVKAINAAPAIREKLETAGLREELLYKDQDAINIAFYGAIKLLNFKYNVFPVVVSKNEEWFFDLYGKENVIESRSNPFIVHYISLLKPWIYTTEYLARRWWRYMKMQNKTIRREYVKPFIKENKRLSFVDTLLLAIRGRLRSTGRYYELLREKNQYILRINERLEKYDS
ncbi:MAG: glycosyltransferase family 8 protein [Ruminococcaceae bacterium]|nr:glycosyltransferase family 8 protein [Oscillospiraceae bacterium]